MHIALGYQWSAPATGYHIERALNDLGYQTTFVGPPQGERKGYNRLMPLQEIFSTLSPAPDLYLWIDGAQFPPDIEDLSLPTACYLIDVHLGTSWRKKIARFFDYVFIAQKDYRSQFQAAIGHQQIDWLPLAAAKDVHRRLDLPKIYEVGFVGNIARAHRKTARARHLKLVGERFKTNDFYRPYTPAEVGQVYSQSHIVFNTSIAGDVTMRIFEGTACGALMLTDSVANGLNELFAIGEELVTYRDDDDLLHQIDYYLAHAEARKKIAEAGYQRTQADHHYHHRAQTIVQRIQQPNFQRLAPMRQADPHERAQARRTIYTHFHMLDAILRQAREAGYHPLKKLWLTAPCLIRKLLLS